MSRLTVEVFNTNESKAHGLMNRKSVPTDTGALFLFDVPEVLSFWGKNTLIDLDIAFIRDDWTIESIKTIRAHDLSQVRSDGPCIAAIEVGYGWFEANGVKPGDHAVWDTRTVVEVGDLTATVFEEQQQSESRDPYIFRYASAEDKQFKACWALDNLQPLWTEDNLRKSARFADYKYSFCVWSDIYGPRAVREKLFKEIHEDEDRALVICVGDYDKTPTEDSLKAVREEFDATFGEGRWISTPGNHETEYVDGKPDNLVWYQTHIGPIREARVVNGDTFIMMNTAFKRVLPDDWAWLENELAEARARGGRIFVATHMPCIDSVPSDENAEDHGMPAEDAYLFMALMECYDVSVVFYSHTHGYETWARSGVTYVGTAGGGSPKDEQTEQYHYVKVFVGEIVRIERVPLFPEIPEDVPKEGD